VNARLYVFAGVPKAGSTWFYEQFRRHPAVSVARIKDPFYFDRYHHRGDDWYWSLFGVRGAVAPPGVYADLSHDYIYAPDFAARCLSAASSRGARPFVHLVLRNPVDRFLSAVQYQVSFDGARRPGALHEAYPDLFAGSMYSTHVRRVLDAFPPGSVRVDLFDDLAYDPVALIGDVCTWLDVARSGSWLQAAPSRVRRGPRKPALAAPARQAGWMLRRAGLLRLVERAKSSMTLEQFLFRQFEPEDSVDPDSVGTLKELFAPDVHELVRLLDRDLVALWQLDR
jgi:hypothetical protein